MSDERQSPGPWIVRSLIGIALAGTLVLAGPRAYAVLAARLDGAGAASAPAVDPGRVAVLNAPDWLRGPLLERVLRDIEPALRGPFTFGDEAAAAATAARLERSPWVAEARVRRSPPDRYRVDVDLRRPILAVAAKPLHADRPRGRSVVALVDAAGVLLPPPARAPELPFVEVPAAIVQTQMRLGRVCEEPHVRAATAVALEWAAAIAKEVVSAPRLVEIDAANLGGDYIADPRYSEILVALRASDGRVVWMQYGRAERDSGVVAAATKAWILGQILAEHPGLDGLDAGDLRLRNRWRDCLIKAKGSLSAAPSPRAGRRAR